MHITQRSIPESFRPETFPKLHPILARVFAARGIASDDELDHRIQNMHDPSQLNGIETAIELLYLALQKQESILIIGDFDADGATSSTLAVRALRAMGAHSVDFIVPNRFEYGYGLTPEIVSFAIAAKDRKPDLIVTVDNGIASCDGVRAAQQEGIKVIITDHHLPGPDLPTAEAIVNPNQAGDLFPSKHLAGVGVIFYVMVALRARLRQEGWFSDHTPQRSQRLAQFLDLVALGTVADLVPLDQNNRILVEQGLERIRQGKCCPGIQALLQVAKRDQAHIVASDLGFSIGPRLNAAGRITDMRHGIDCLLSDDPKEALSLATQLDDLNRQRRQIEQDMQAQASKIIDALPATDISAGIALFHPEWHQGVIGILAARIKERLHRPVIAFAPSGISSGVSDETNHEIKGSARSIPGLHIRDTLDRIATREPGLILRFGGHAMAAGLSIKGADFPRFQIAFREEVARRVTDEDLRGLILSDGTLGAKELTLTLAEAIRAAVPWGQGMPEPLFDDNFTILNKRVVGQKHLRLELQHTKGGQTITGIAFNTDYDSCPAVRKTAYLIYHLDVNIYRGTRSLQLRIEKIGQAQAS